MRLGVITPVWCSERNNRVHLFEDTAGSVLAQDYDFTWLVVDNGSTDEKILDFYETLSDTRIKIEKIALMSAPLTWEKSLNLFNEGYFERSLVSEKHENDSWPQSGNDPTLGRQRSFNFGYSNFGRRQRHSKQN